MGFSILGPVLFYIFINDLDARLEDLKGMLNKFVDSTKLREAVNWLEGGEALDEIQEEALDSATWARAALNMC